MRSVVRGKLRVDPSRAIDKLRQHQLIDPHLYLNDLVRSAVAAGARSIQVDEARGRIVVAHDGAVPEPTQLEHLMSFVFDANAEELHLRFLALGVNASLALAPKRISIECRDGDASYQATVSAASLVEREGELGVGDANADALPHPHTCRITVDRRRGWFGDDDLPELDLLRKASRDLETKLVMPGEVEREAWVRMPFSLDERRGYVELNFSGSACWMHFLEYGVELVRVPWGLKGLERLKAFAVGARAVVKGKELPTNASRNLLRQHSRLEWAAKARAEETMGQLILALGNKVAHGLDDDQLLVQGLDDRELDQLLGGVLCTLDPCRRSVPAHLESLLDLPLLRDGTGARRTLRTFLARREFNTCRELQDQRIRGVAEQFLLLEGRSIERALAPKWGVDGSYVSAEATRGVERRARHLAHPAMEPTLPERKYRAHGELAGRGDCAGLSGVVGVLDPQETSRTGLWCQLHVEGRVLETMTLPSNSFPLPLDASVSWDEGLKPTLSYDRVQRNAQFNRMLHELARRGAQLVAEMVEKEGADDCHKLVRAAVGTLLKTSPGGRKAELPDALVNAHAWTTTDGHRVSLKELATYADVHGVLYCAHHGATSPDGRPLLTEGDLETRWAIETVAPALGIAPYTDLGSVDEDERLTTARAAVEFDPELPGMSFERKDQVGFVCVSPNAELILLHRGEVVHRLHRAQGNPCSIAVDDLTAALSKNAKRTSRERINPEKIEKEFLTALGDGSVPWFVTSASPSPEELWSASAVAARTFLLVSMNKARDELTTRKRALERAQKRFDKHGGPHVPTLEKLLSRAKRAHEEANHLCHALRPLDAFVLLTKKGTPRVQSFREIEKRFHTAKTIFAHMGSSELPRVNGPTLLIGDEFELSALKRWDRRVKLLEMAAPRQRPRKEPMPATDASPEESAREKRRGERRRQIARMGGLRDRKGPSFLADAPFGVPPADALASHRFEDERLSTGVRVTGHVWLPRTWSPSHDVHFWHEQRWVQSPPGAKLWGGIISASVPVAGELQLHEDHALELAWALIQHPLATVALAMAEQANLFDAAWHPYLWHLGLLSGMCPLLAVSVTGENVTAADLATEFGSKGRIYLAPDAACAKTELERGDLVLLDTPSALLTVLNQCPIQGSVVRLGGERGWGSSIEMGFQTLSAALLAEDDPSPNVSEEAHLCHALEVALTRLELAGNPVTSVRMASTGRPVSYQSLKRRILLDSNTPEVKLAVAKRAGADVLSALLSSAVAEVNRGLTCVTDAEERRALLTQLYALPEQKTR